jgi:hypothetical protein
LKVLAHAHLEMVAPRARGKAHVFEGLVGHDKLVLLGAAHRCAAGCRLAVSDLIVAVRMRVSGAAGRRWAVGGRSGGVAIPNS